MSFSVEDRVRNTNDKPSGLDLLGDPESGGWLMSFADLLAIILTFFVVIFAASVVAPDNRVGFLEQVGSHLAGAEYDTQIVDARTPSVGDNHFVDVGYLANILRQRLQTADIDLPVTVENEAQRVVVGLNKNDSFSLLVSGDQLSIFEVLGSSLIQIDNGVSVEITLPSKEAVNATARENQWSAAFESGLTIIQGLKTYGVEAQLTARRVTGSTQRTPSFAVVISGPEEGVR